jgi:hypothetical protein
MRPRQTQLTKPHVAERNREDESGFVGFWHRIPLSAGTEWMQHGFVSGGRRRREEKTERAEQRGTHTTRGAPQKIRETISPSQRPPQLPETELIFVLKKSFFGLGFHVSWIRNAAACSRGTKEKTTRKRTAASARQVRRVAVGG